MIRVKDLSLAAASLLRSGGYATTIVLTLGLTLGALVAMFSLNYQLLATSLPYPNESQLYLSKGNAYKDGEVAFANEAPYPALLMAYKDEPSYFDDAALVAAGADVVRNRADSPRVAVSYVTPEYFGLLAAPLQLGREFNPNEGLDTNSPVAVISARAWSELFNDDPNALGQVLRFGEVDFKVIGVTAENFTEPELGGPGATTQVWLPWDYNPLPARARNSWTRTNSDQYLLGRLKSGAQWQQAQSELTSTMSSRFKEETAGQPFFDNISIDFTLVALRQVILGDSKGRALLLFGGVLALLLIAASNITNLTLARAANQQRNMAIQAALGAQRSHLFTAVFAEIGVLMAAVSVLSQVVAYGGIELLKVVASSQLPRLTELHLSWQSCVFGVLCAFLLASVFAWLVSRQINYRALHSMLQSGGKGTGIQVSRLVRKLLIISQVALTGILLAISVHVLQLSVRHLAQPLGFTTRDVHYLSLSLGGQLQASPEERANDLLAIRNKLREYPKVVDASLASGLPIHRGGDVQWKSFLSVEQDFNQQYQAATSLVDDRYLEILGLPLLSGRSFRAGDEQAQAKVIVVNETFARQLQADGQVLGQRFYWRNSPDRGKTPYEVIGIVRDISLPGRAEESRMFVPQLRTEDPLVLVQLKPGQELSKVEVNELLAQVNGEYKVSTVLSMQAARDLLVAQDSLSASVTAALVVLALSLAAIGIYGVLSYTVLIRRPELGIRMAVGARPSTVFLQVLRDNMMPMIVGLSAALIALGAFGRWLESSEYVIQVSSFSWVLSIVLIVVLAAAATLLSVWRVISQPAIHALRNS